MLKRKDTDEWFSNEIRPTTTLKGHTNSVECLKINPTNYANIFSGSHDHTIKSWDINFGECKDTLSGHK
jgi:WD40 repeat protein